MTIPALLGAPVNLPTGRGRWRLVAYRRQFSTALPVAVGELNTARGRRLEQKLNEPASLTFTIDGHDPSAAQLLELATDVIAYRWDDRQGRDVAMFRGLIDHSEDQITEQSAVVTFTAHDYLAMLNRRLLTSAASQYMNFAQWDQDAIVAQLLNSARAAASSTNVSFSPGSYLPLAISQVDPSGVGRAYSGVLRDRNYQPGQNIGEAIDNLAAVINGFDYAARPYGPQYQADALAVYYPQQGVTRDDAELVYGINVSSLTRTVSSGDYANYVRVIGNKASSDANAPQLFAEAWNNDANNITVNPIGTWMTVENASDVSLQTTLNEKAQGDLATAGLIVPSYTVKLRPGAYTYGTPNMGDTVPLIIQEGRLNVNTLVRMVGLSFDIGEDGDENVGVTLGRPAPNLVRLLTAGANDIDALARR
jgi:hypothetical protein